MRVFGCCNIFSIGISTLIGLIIGLLFLISVAPVVFLPALISSIISGIVLILLVFITTSAHNHGTIIVLIALRENGVAILFSAIATLIASLSLLVLPVSINLFYALIVITVATAFSLMSIVFTCTIYRLIRLTGSLQ